MAPRTSRRRRPPAAALALALPLVGCTYLKDRANDALDVFRFDVGWGPGLYVEARATDFAAAGLGYRNQTMAGLHGRYTGTYRAGSLGFGIYTFGDASRHDYWPVIAAYEFDPDQDVVPQQYLFMPSMGFFRSYRFAKRGLHVADLDCSVALVAVGASVGFSPGELLDFVLGIVGIDLGGDDVCGLPPAPRLPPPANVTDGASGPPAHPGPRPAR